MTEDEKNRISAGLLIFAAATERLMQAWLDKNGKEIYEGDIVQFNARFLTENILRVGYEYSHRGGFSLCTKEGYYGMFGDAWLEPFYCEVIGNIHDNPELLK